MIIETETEFTIENEREENINSLFDKVNSILRFSDKDFSFKKIDKNDLNYVLRISAKSFFKFVLEESKVYFQLKHIKQNMVEKIFNRLILDVLTFIDSVEECNHCIKWNGCSTLSKRTTDEYLTIDFDILSGIILYERKEGVNSYSIKILEVFDDSYSMGFMSNCYLDVYKLMIDVKVHQKMKNEKYLLKYIF